MLQSKGHPFSVCSLSVIIIPRSFLLWIVLWSRTCRWGQGRSWQFFFLTPFSKSEITNYTYFPLLSFSELCFSFLGLHTDPVTQEEQKCLGRNPEKAKATIFSFTLQKDVLLWQTLAAVKRGLWLGLCVIYTKRCCWIAAKQINHNHWYSSAWRPTRKERCKLFRRRSYLLQYALQRGDVEVRWYSWKSQPFVSGKPEDKTSEKAIPLWFLLLQVKPGEQPCCWAFTMSFTAYRGEENPLSTPCISPFFLQTCADFFPHF